MAAIVSATDVLTYNGFTFPQSFTNTTTTARFNYDAAGRTVTYTVVTIKATSKIVAAAGAQTATLAAIRTALERPGGSLTLTGKGYDIQANQNGQPSDVRWGPRPQVLEWKTLGGGNAAEITWQCEVALNNCSGASWAGKILEYTYSLTYSTDESGYTTKTHSGSITIPMTRVNVAAGAIPDTADNYFDAVVPPLISNFKRTISRTLSLGKERLDFTVTDTEQAGNPLPVGVVSATASHDLATIQTGKTGAVFLRWNGTITAEYEFVKGKSRADAFQMFMDLVNDRSAADRKLGCTYLPVSMKISEPEIYGRSAASLSFTYSMVWGANNVKSKFPTNGIWRPVPGSNWNKWATSLAAARGNRGLANMRHHAGDDIIVDLCLGNGVGAVAGGAGSTGSSASSSPDSSTLRTNNLSTDWNKVAQQLGIPAQLPVLGSWLEYDCRLIVEPVDHNVIHKPLPTSNAAGNPAKTAQQAAVISALFSSPTTSFYGAPQTSPTTIVQNIGGTDFYLRLVGRAVRAGYEIPPPVLRSVGNGPVVPVNHPNNGNYFSTWTAAYTTHPIQCAEWNLRWFCQLPAGGIGINVTSPPRPDKPANVLPGTVR